MTAALILISHTAYIKLGERKKEKTACNQSLQKKRFPTEYPSFVIGDRRFKKSRFCRQWAV